MPVMIPYRLILPKKFIDLILNILNWQMETGWSSFKQSLIYNYINHFIGLDN